MRNIFLCIATIVVLGCSSGNSPYDKALNQYEEMIASFEKLSNKDAICQSDMLKFSIEMIPRMTSMQSELEQIKSTGQEISQDQIQRYADLTLRFTTVLSAMDKLKANEAC